jgi:hypothetical protein
MSFGKLVENYNSIFRVEECPKYEGSRVLQNVHTYLATYLPTYPTTQQHIPQDNTHMKCDPLFADIYNTEWHAAWKWGKFPFTGTSKDRCGHISTEIVG